MEANEVQARIERESRAALRDVNKKQAEALARSAMRQAKRAYTLFIKAECPKFAQKAMDAAHLLSEVC